MPWGFFALVFFVSVIVGASVAARKQRRPPASPPEKMN